MRVIRNFKNLHSDQALSLTIGNFDGVHLGHQEILKKVKEKAQKNGLKSAIITFSNHPIKFFSPNAAQNFLISSLAQKLSIFKENSIDFVFVLPFDEKFCEISADYFAREILQKELRVKELIIGHDFSFGKNREGNFSTLQNYDFGAMQVGAIKKNGFTISSSQIRKFLKAGEIKKSNEFLGRDFSVRGIVINGFKRGREIGFPTINMKSKPHLIQPKFGVYKSKIFVDFLNKEFDSITNFGTKPTVSGDAGPLFETHIFDFNEGEIYGKKVSLKLLDFVRDEKKFSSIDELQKQIRLDANSLHKP